MLYSFIPPILIILSLAAIVVFLLKKSKEVAQISDEVFLSEGEINNLEEPSGLVGKVRHKVRSVRQDDVKHFFLAILERTVRRSRVFFLKMETRFGGWSEDIRTKRKARMEKKMAIREAQGTQQPEGDVMQKLREYKGRPPVETWPEETEVKEQAIKTTVEKKAVAPKRRTEIKDRLEELLIERIAVNPKDIEAYERLGEYYMEIKSYRDAKECFKQVIKLDSSNKNAKYRMKRLETLLAKK